MRKPRLLGVRNKVNELVVKQPQQFLVYAKQFFVVFKPEKPQRVKPVAKFVKPFFGVVFTRHIRAARVVEKPQLLQLLRNGQQPNVGQNVQLEPKRLFRQTRKRKVNVFDCNLPWLRPSPLQRHPQRLEPPHKPLHNVVRRVQKLQLVHGRKQQTVKFVFQIVRKNAQQIQVVRAVVVARVPPLRVRVPLRTKRHV